MFAIPKREKAAFSTQSRTDYELRMPSDSRLSSAGKREKIARTVEFRYGQSFAICIVVIRWTAVQQFTAKPTSGEATSNDTARIGIKPQ